MPTGGGGGSGGRAGDIRAGGAVWEISAKDNYSAALNRAAADTRKWSAETGGHLGRISEGFNKITGAIGASGFAGEFSQSLSLAANSAFGLQGAIVTLGAVAGKKIFDLVAGVEELNKQLERGKDLSGKLVEGIARIRGKSIAEAIRDQDLPEMEKLFSEVSNSKATEEENKKKLARDIELSQLPIDQPDFARVEAVKEAKRRIGQMGGLDAARQELERLQASLANTTKSYNDLVAAINKAKDTIRFKNSDDLGKLLSSEVPAAMDRLIDKAKDFAKAWTGGDEAKPFGKIAARNAMIDDLQKIPEQLGPIVGRFQEFIQDWTRPDGPLGAWGKLAAGLENGLGLVRGGQGGGDLQAMLGLGDRFDRVDREQLRVQQEIKQEVHKLPPAIANEFAAQFKIK